MTKIIISVHPNSEKEALQELKKHSLGTCVEKLEENIFLYETTMDFPEFSKAIRQRNICFVRQIIPVNLKYHLSQTQEDCFLLVKEIKEILSKLKEKEIILHVSFLSKKQSYDKKSFVDPLLNVLKKYKVVVNHTANQILSIVLIKNTAYIGISSVKESLTSWPLGHPHYAYRKEQICRAEFKIIESIDLFNLDLSKYKNAVDLGAAPGGWTRLLLERGMNVIAVDPAELDSSLSQYKKLIHYKGLSQNFFKEHPGKYDLIVNDMRMNVKDSVKIMQEASHYLSDKGLAIMTLKLNPNKKLSEVEYALKELKKNFNIKKIRQLYHNRSEATVLLGKLRLNH